MWEAITGFVLANAKLLWIAVSIVLAIVTLMQKSVQLWITDFWMANGFLFGTCISKLSKNENQGPNGWMIAEENLCAVYKPFVPQLLTKDEFDNKIEYMKCAGDLGREPTPFYIYVLLFALVAAESAGFAYLLGTVAASEGSSHIHEIIMWAIMFVLAVILPFLMHHAGHQLYRTKLLEAHHKDYKRDNKDNEYSGQNIALNDNQFNDKLDKPYTRCLRRVAKTSRDQGSYVLVYTAVAAIVIIFSASTWMRVANFQTQQTEQTALMQAGASAGNPFELPDAVKDPQSEADHKAVTDRNGSNAQENIAGFIMLGFIFVFTQIVGIVFGYKYGFVGRETLKKKTGAYAETLGYPSFNIYANSIDNDVDHINNRLKTLQNKLKDLHGVKGELKKNFRDYLRQKLGEKEPNGNSDLATPVEDAKNAIIGIADKEEQMSYYKSLTPEIKEELKPWLQARKKAEDELQAKKKIQEEDLSGLF